MSEISIANSSISDSIPCHPERENSLRSTAAIHPKGLLPQNNIAMEETVVPFDTEVEVPEMTDSGFETHQSDNSSHELEPTTAVPVKPESTSQDSTSLEIAALPTRRRITSRILSLMNDVWAWEILSCVLATTCLIAIVATLAVHQDHPLPQWPNYISINSLIAIMTAIMKASLMVPIAEGTFSIYFCDACLWFLDAHILRNMSTQMAVV